ncbi:ABC transporter permease [Pseudomonas syringae]|uniref:Permease component n=1 Tax=Pseudomonas syringae pv. actinidiae TaxID=103796 RepID=A0A2V0QEH8_PSESF|nr:ABC transporter permease [Pseudomonas syringae]BBI43255.1 glutathione transport system permease protein GsiC [Pseudomonas syringae pv. actinidiae]GBH11536.1 permease component [Pseudomonas syringae pv. actinidiae]
MLVFVLRRLGISLCVALTVSILSFALLHFSGDLAISIAGPDASFEQIEQIRKQLGLDQPMINQYLTWLYKVLHLDLGNSFFFQDSVVNLIASRLPITMGLGASALVLSLIISIPLGIIAAVKKDTWIDRAALSFAVLGQALPNFWFALMLIVVFSVTLHWLPVSGNTTYLHFVMPTIALAYYAIPSIMRLTRAGMLDVLSADYIRTAKAKGLRPGRIIFKHAFRNALIPVVALAAVEFGMMLGGSVVIETVFALQGIGQLAWDGISRNDFPVVQAVVLLVALIYIVLTLVADVLNAMLDPRIRVK